MNENPRKHLTTRDIRASIRGLARSIARHDTDETFARYADWVYRLPHHSVDNLVQMRTEWQMRSQADPSLPELSYVADRQEWQAMGRSVKPGERGILFYLPVDSIECAYSAEAATNEPLRPTQGAFQRRYAFDVSQTEGDEVPNWYRDLEPGVDDVLPALVDFARARGIEVAFELLGKPNGVSTHGRIAVNSARPTSIQVQTLLHETTHQLLGHVRTGPDAPAQPRRRVAEAEAEAVAVAVMRALGHDTTTTAGAYVRSNRGCSKDVTAGLARAAEAARTILDHILPRLPRLGEPDGTGAQTAPDPAVA